MKTCSHQFYTLNYTRLFGLLFLLESAKECGNGWSRVSDENYKHRVTEEQITRCSPKYYKAENTWFGVYL